MKSKVVVCVGLVLTVVSVGTLVSCNRSKAPEQAQEGARAPSPEARPEHNPDRNPYFGEEHIHTSWSVDAWVFGNRITGPDDALKYAQGQTIVRAIKVAECLRVLEESESKNAGRKLKVHVR